jgi:hypothetical protein
MPQSDPDIVAREALRLIGPDPQNWVPDRDDVDHNVFSRRRRTGRQRILVRATAGDNLASHEERINGSIAEDFAVELYASAVWRSPHTVAAE